MVIQFVDGLYIIAGVMFIASLAGLSRPATARMGTLTGMVGMALALGRHHHRTRSHVGQRPRPPLGRRHPAADRGGAGHRRR